MDFLLFAILLTTSLVLCLYWISKKAHSFFENLGVPHLRPKFILGDVTSVILLRKSLTNLSLEIYKQLEPHKFGGAYAFLKPVLFIRDPELLRNIFTQDFAHFNDRGLDIDMEVEPLSHNLLTMKANDEWKFLRTKLATIFTPAKLKMTFPLIIKCGEKLTQVLDRIPPDESFDIKDFSMRYTIDVIGNCVFGLDINSLENPKSEFRLMGSNVMKFRFATLVRSLQMKLPSFLMRLLNMTFVDLRTQNYFRDLLQKTVEYRQQNNIIRDDFLDLLIALKNTTPVKESHNTDDPEKSLDGANINEPKTDTKFTDQSLIAQSFLFFVAGFETSSTALCYAFLELSLNPDIQDKVRQEVISVLSTNGGQITYDALKQMTNLDLVILETLRKYPPVGSITRKSTQDYKIPNTDIITPKDTFTVIPVYGIHSDEKYYPNAQQFQPERFTEEEKSKRPYFAYLPFGAGPRHCIGSSFAKMTIKIALVHAFRDLSFQVSPQMKFPVEFNKNFGFLTPSRGVLLAKNEPRKF